MRVTGGDWRGLQIEPPKGPVTRTTLDHVRQAIFNLVGDKVVGASVLDLYSGSGALGIEALSRGAAQATFVDRSFFSIQMIQANLASLPLEIRHPEPLTFFRAEVLSAIRRLGREGEKFDLIFLDPPYGRNLLIKSLNALCQYAIVSQAGWVVAECEKREKLPPRIQGKELALLLQRHKQYGDTALSVYETVGG